MTPEEQSELALYSWNDYRYVMTKKELATYTLQSSRRK